MNQRISFIDTVLPEYRIRHVFVTKLRLIAFVGFWALYLYFLRDVLIQTIWVAVVVFLSFLVTGFANYNVIKGRWLIPSFIGELFCDFTFIASILYLTDGPYSPYFTAYVLYVIIAGILYNHFLAGIVAASAIVYYGAFLILCNAGIIPPLIIEYGDRLPIPSYTPFAHFLLAAVLLGGIVYTVKVASFFSQRRERTLEKRNRELTALHTMSQTIRSAIALREVIDQLLKGVLDGLGFETAALLYFDHPNDKARLHIPGRHPKLSEIEGVIGRKLDGLEFPVNAISSPAMNDIMKHKIIFRRDMGELLVGLEAVISPEKGRRIQQMLGVRRIVVVPIVAERETLGAIIGLSKETFVEDGQVATLEAFANQSALSLEAALLIDQLRKVNVELKEANRVKSEFLATMSHELRTPLTAIIGFSELLLEGVMGELADEQRESLTEVVHNAADLLGMINSLLDLSKIESGTMRMEMTTFDINEVAKRVTNTLTPLVQKKGQELSVQVEKGLLPVAGDERKVQQILLNLLANANKFTLSNGHIFVNIKQFVSCDEIIKKTLWHEKVTDIINNLKDGCVEIIVEDDGIGIPAEQHDRIFDMFHQADSSSTRSFAGTGLGLALARRFVDLHGGKIWVESEPGKGAKFTVILPINARGS